MRRKKEKEERETKKERKRERGIHFFISPFRSIASVCGLWDIDLIEFELNRTSTLRHLVE